MSDHGGGNTASSGGSFLAKPIRNAAVTAAGVAVVAQALRTGNLALGSAGGTATGVVAGIGAAVHNTLQAITPTAVAGIAAPFATALGALYLTNKGLDTAGIENIVARRVAQAGSLVAGAGATVMSPFVLGGAAILGVGQLAVTGWKEARHAWSHRRSSGGNHTPAAH